MNEGSKSIEGDLNEAVEAIELWATRLSELLGKFDLASIPLCEKDLNKGDIGTKIKAAKHIVTILKAAREL